MLDENGQVPYLDGFILNITEEKNAKQAMERRAVLVRNSSKAMFLLRGPFLIDCNDAALRLFGFQKDELIGQKPDVLSPPRQPDGCDSIERGHQLISATAHGGPQRFEWLHQRRNGSVFDAEISLNRIMEDGEVIVFSIVRDVTDRKQREREMQKLNARLEQRVAERTADLQAAAAETDRLRLSVADDGVGMSSATLKRIFDPFYTTRLVQGGSGLGLLIVYTLTTGILDGRIDVRSEPGKGNVFELHLPLRVPTDAAPERVRP